MKILIIDDSNTLRFVIIKMLQELGYRDIHAVATAEEAMPLVTNENYDLVLLDWNLPRMSGLDFLKYLRENHRTEKLKVIMVTTVQEKSNIIKAAKLGIKGYIIKPVTRELLSLKIAELDDVKEH